MDFSLSPNCQHYLDRVRAFMEEHLEPIEADIEHQLSQEQNPFRVVPEVEALRKKAREEGLWNLFLPDHEHGVGLSNVEYAPIAEQTGRSFIAPEIFHCNAPDTGNMEVLVKYGSDEQKERWLAPLLAGEIRSAFCMTEPAVASSDATNMEATATIDGDDVVLSGTKWWSTGIGHPDCKMLIFMGLTFPDAPRHQQHSMVLVDREHPQVEIERLTSVFGEYDPPHGHGIVHFKDVRLPQSAIILGPGRGFEIAQGRLGPGRIHHCMRAIGMAEKALELMCRRGMQRTAFGKKLVDLGGNLERIAEARIALDSARLLVLKAAWMIDQAGPKGARSEIAQIKVAVPRMAQKIIDQAIQIHGAAGLDRSLPLATMFGGARALRIADGPDEVHLGTVAKQELRKHL
jgi:alkylation response protein AidB-like acyl-CoA dehydrogenase